VTHDVAEWKEEIAWMSLYFCGAVWASLALVVFSALGDQLPRLPQHGQRAVACGGRYSCAAGEPRELIRFALEQPSRQ
jgi:hypothetical protein